MSNKVLAVNGYFPHIAKKISNLGYTKFDKLVSYVFNGKIIKKHQFLMWWFYGKSKAYGEINDTIIYDGHLMDIIFTKHGLLEWF